MTGTRRRRRLSLAAILVAGLALRVWMLGRYPGAPADIASATSMRDAIRAHGFNAYAFVDPPGSHPAYPYPPGWVPVLLALIPLAHALSISTSAIVRAPLVVADIALAALVYAVLGWRGHSDRLRLAGAALVALGPPFIANSTLQGQLDEVNALLVLAAIAVWMRGSPTHRWLWAGLLIGVGASIKTTPAFALLALLPTAHDNRERIRLAAVSVLIPAAAIAPFQLANHETLQRILSYHGAPGAGGISLLVQPRLAFDWLSAGAVPIDSAVSALNHLALGLALLGVLTVAVIAWRRRLEPVAAAVLVYAALLVCDVNFFLQYLVWLLPLLIASGRLRLSACVELVWLVPLVFRYGDELGWHTSGWSKLSVTAAYVPVMDAMWVALVIWTALRVRRVREAAPRQPAQ